MRRINLITALLLSLTLTTAYSQTLNLKKVFSKKSNAEIPINTEAGEFEANGIRYKAINNTDAVVIPQRASGDIYIPKTVKNNGKTYKVTKVSDRAFAGNKRLRTVNISDTEISEIGNAAFSGCMFLNCVSMPNTVTRIGDDAFHMTNISAIELPTSLRTLGKRAFYFSAIKEVSLPEGLTKIDSRTFSGCASMTEVKVPTSVEAISDDAFENSPMLKKIDVASGNKTFVSSTDGKIHRK